MLMQHGGVDQTPIGIWSGLDEDDRGLKMKGKLALNVKRGADAYALLKMQRLRRWRALDLLLGLSLLALDGDFR